MLEEKIATIEMQKLQIEEQMRYLQERREKLETLASNVGDSDTKDEMRLEHIEWMQGRISDCERNLAPQHVSFQATLEELSYQLAVVRCGTA